MTRIMILGGDGFVGRSFITLQRDFSNLRIVSRVASFPDLHEFVVGNPSELSKDSFRDIDVVFNCLGIAHRKDLANKDLFYQVNRDLAISLARKAKTAGVGTFIQMSSISVYGNNPLIDVSSSPNPQSNYGRSKAEADDGLLSLHDNRFRTLILRPPMIYGRGAPGNIAKLIHLVSILPVLPFADATEPRESIFIGNFVKQVEFAISGGISGVMLMKDVRSFCTLELVEIINRGLGMNKRIINFPLKNLLRLLAPEYYRRLFGRLIIKNNVVFPDNVVSAFLDPAEALFAML